MSTISTNTAVSLAENDEVPILASTSSDGMFMQDVDGREEVETLQQDEDDAEADSDDADDSVSVCATIRYGQEPFKTFQQKISELAGKVFHKKQSDIIIEQMKGGCNNRVFGVTISPKLKKFTLKWLKSCLCPRPRNVTTESETYVVRVPRVEVIGDNAARSMREDMKQEAAILETVKSRLSLPTPQVVHYDLTTDNIFERPYMIQKRLPGKNLQNQLWNELNTEQKKSVMKQVANLPSIIASVQGPAGSISIDNLSRSCDLLLLTNRFSTSASHGLSCAILVMVARRSS